MKNIYIIIISFLIVFSLGCDKIEGEYRENPDELQSTVTLFEFTGITCVNCPDAHEMVDNLKSQFGENLQTVSIHGDEFAGPINGWFLRTQEGQDLAESMNVSGLPKGSVNSLANLSATTMTVWGDNIAKVGYKFPDLIMDVTHEVNESDTTISVSIEGQFEESILEPYQDLYIGIYLLENKIIGWQDDINEGRIEDYEHKDVLRSSFNGIFGELYVQKAQAGMKIDELEHSLKIKSGWNKENLEVLVFVYKKSNKELIPFKVNYN